MAGDDGRTAREQVISVLLVEDNPGDADLIEDRLSAAHGSAFAVTVAGTLSKALGLLEADPVDVVLLDLDLPDSRGIATVQRLRAAQPDVPLVVLSGMDAEAVHQPALSAGAEDALAKNEPVASLFARSILYAMATRGAILRWREAEALVDANPDAVLVVDDDGAVQFVNDAAVALFGRTREELLGEAIGFSVTPGETMVVDILCVDEVRRGEVRVAEVGWMGYPAALAVIRDVTERERLAEQLRQAQKMEAIGRLAGGVAHDFNNQLTAILSSAELALEHADVTTAEFLDDIIHAAKQAAGTTGQLLDFSRRSPQRVSEVDVNELLDGTRRLLRRLIGAGIEVVVAADPVVDRITTDRSQLERTLLNLAINARDAMPGGGRLTLRTGNVALEAGALPDAPDLPAGRYVHIAVADTGEGMPESVVQQIFEPFFTTKETGKGTGLGLATVYGAMAQSGGAITVSSEVGRGTTFNLYLPAYSSAPRPSSEPHAAAPAPGRAAVILVAEDDDRVRRIVTAMLEAKGFEVVATAGGAAALEVLGARAGPAVDLLLTDVVMPGMSGPELLRRVRERHPDVAAAFMSGFATDAAERQAIPDDVPFLQKPFDRSELMDVVDDALGLDAW